MNLIETIFSQPNMQVLGWVLLHFIWQGTIVAILLASVNLLLRLSTANIRYTLSCAAMLMILVLPLVTLCMMQVSSSPVSMLKSESGLETAPLVIPKPATSMSSVDDRLVNSHPGRPVINGEGNLPRPAETLIPPKNQSFFEIFETLLPWFVAAWMFGVLFRSLKLLGGWAYAQRLKRSKIFLATEELERILARISKQLRISRPVRLFESALIQVPTVIGWLHPVILLPVSVVTGLTPQQLQAILAHELAHIRRHDYLINLMQTFVEALLFYHPAVWWVSHRINVEREHCCDDLAVAVCGDVLTYARALAELEELRSTMPQLALAASGGSLLERIGRLVNASSRYTNRPTRWFAGMAILMSIVILGFGMQISLLSSNAGDYSFARLKRKNAQEIGLGTTNGVLDEKHYEYQTLVRQHGFSGGRIVGDGEEIVHGNSYYPANQVQGMSANIAEAKTIPLRGVHATVAVQPGLVVQAGNYNSRNKRETDPRYYRIRRGAHIPSSEMNFVLSENSPIEVIPGASEKFQIQASGYPAEPGGVFDGIVDEKLMSRHGKYHFSFQAETDNLADPGDKFLNTYSYGYSDYRVTSSGPVPGTDNKLRFFVAGEYSFERDRIKRFFNGFNIQHAETFVDDRNFPLTLERNREDALEAFIRERGIVMQDGVVPNARRKQWIGNGTIVYDSDPFNFRVNGAISWLRQDEVIGNFPRMLFNLDRTEQEEFSSGFLNFKFTHKVHPETFYEVDVSYFDRRELQYDPILKHNFWAYWDSTANAERGIQFFSFDQPWRGGTEPMEIYGFDFEAPGSPNQSDYIKSKRGYVGGSFALNSKYRGHELRVGGSFKRWTTRTFNISERTQFIAARTNPDVYRGAVAGDPEATGEFRVAAGDQQRQTYGYDSFGNEIDSDGVYGSRHPKYGEFYFQGKYELLDLIVNAGLRVDMIDNDQFSFKDPSNPPWNRASGSLFEDELIKVDPEVEVSPRLGMAFPITDRTVFHTQYGKFVQPPQLTELFNGPAWRDDIIAGRTSFQTQAVGIALKPEKTTRYEIGFSHQVSNSATIDATVFHKNIKDQIQVGRIVTETTSQATDYNVLVNGEFAATSGIEVTMKLRRTARVAAQLDYTYSKTLSTSSTSADAVSGIALGSEVPMVISPSDFHRPHKSSMNFDYRFGKDDGGRILEQLGANLLFTFSSGHPFTLVEGDFGQQDESLGGVIGDARLRRPLEDVNGSLTPWNYSLDLRIDKTVNRGAYNLNFYVYVQNLINRRNVINVFSRTGDAFDDGFLSDEDLSGAIVAAHGGDAYVALYEAINASGNGINYRSNLALRANDIDSGTGSGGELFGTPRQIRAGMRVEF